MESVNDTHGEGAMREGLMERMRSTSSSGSSSSSSLRTRRRSKARKWTSPTSQDFTYAVADTAISEWLKCPICLLPFLEPVVASSKCEHVFCKLCIRSHVLAQGQDVEEDREDTRGRMEARIGERQRGEGRTLKVQATCPTCRAPLAASPPYCRPAAPLIRNMVDSLLVKCPHTGRGCTHTCERGLVRSHMLNDCGYAYVGEHDEDGDADDAKEIQGKDKSKPTRRLGRCDCGQKVMRKDWEQHTTSPDQCALVRVSCPFRSNDETESGGCREMIQEHEVDEHLDVCPAFPLQCLHCASTHPRSYLAQHEAECQEAFIECGFARHGCSWRGKRRQLDPEHMPQCIYAPLAAFFDRNASELESLRNDNARLHLLLEDVSRRQSETEKMLAACVDSLGSFYVDVNGDPARAQDISYSTPSTRQSNISSLLRHRSGSENPLSTTMTTSTSQQRANDANTEEAQATNPSRLHRSLSESVTAADIASASPSTSAPAAYEPATWRWPEPHDPSSNPSPTGREHAPDTQSVVSSNLSQHLVELQATLGTLTAQLRTTDRRAEEGHLAALSAGFEASRAHEEMNSQRHALHAMRLQIHQLAMVQQQQQHQQQQHHRGVPSSSSSSSSQTQLAAATAAAAAAAAGDGSDASSAAAASLLPPSLLAPLHHHHHHHPQPAFPIPIAPMAPHFRRFWTGFEQTKL